MTVFEELTQMGHEQVVFYSLGEAGLKAIIAIHDTTLGPALGGCRMFPYKSEEAAVHDVLRLSRAMTYKAAAAGLHLGGGKAVIIGDPKQHKTEILFRGFGKAVNSMGGRYITAEDVGTDVDDMEFIFSETDYVTGVDTSLGGSGNPAPYTALGVLQGILASTAKVFGDPTVENLTVAVQGLGAVGSNLVRLLKQQNARVIGCDSDPERASEQAERWGIDEIVGPDEIFDVPCDIFAPCAMGSAINDETIDRLNCKVVAGAANNQLARDEVCGDLQERGILYAPDFVINAGGLINVYVELEGYNSERAERITRKLFYNTIQIFRLAERHEETTVVAARRMVRERLANSVRLQHKLNRFPARAALHRQRHEAADAPRRS
jgi:leucine dehydrogenase